MKSFRTLAVAIGLAVAATLPAKADSFSLGFTFGNDRAPQIFVAPPRHHVQKPLSGKKIARSLRHQGYQDISILGFDGSTYAIRARDGRPLHSPPVRG